MVRIKYYQFYGFGQFPKAVVFDKIDIVGSTIHPFYRYDNVPTVQVAVVVVVIDVA